MSALSSFAPLLRPFEQVVLWAQAVLPPRLRGLAVLDLAKADGPMPQGRAVQVRVAPEALLLRRLPLPPAVDDPMRARAYAAARLDEVSPWAPGDFLWDAQPDPAAAKGSGLVLAMMPAAPLRLLENRLETAGSTLAEVICPARPGHPGFGFRADQQQQVQWRNRLMMLAGLLLALGLGLTLWQGQLALAANRDAAAASEALDRLASQAIATGERTPAALALLSRKTEAQSLAQVLNLLARRLPDESWLDSVTMEPGGFEISGRSSRPDAIIPALAADPAFAEVDFAGSSSRDPQTGLFTFTIKSRIAGSPAEAP